MAIEKDSFMAASAIVNLEPVFQAFVIPNIRLPQNCSLVQLRVLFLLQKVGTLTLSEIAGHLRVTKQHMSQSIPGMEENGLVVRSQRGGNRKNMYISITDKGIAVLEDYIYSASEHFGELINDLSHEDKEQLLSCCNRMNSIFSQCINNNYPLMKKARDREEK